MSIFSRTRDIVAANFADLLDKAEDPAKMIRMIILEMEETLVEVRASAARTIADQKEMRRQIARLDKLQESWTEKAELALSKGREDLAHGALTEKQKAADMADSLRAEIEAARRRDARLRGRHRQAAGQAARGPHAAERDPEPARERQPARPAARDDRRPQGRRGLLPLRPARAPGGLCRRPGRSPRARRPAQDVSTRKSPSFATPRRSMPSSRR